METGPTTNRSTQQIFLEHLLDASMTQGAGMETESASPGHPPPSNTEKTLGGKSEEPVNVGKKH